MAVIQYAKIEFLQSSGTFNAGDILDLYVDTDAVVIPSFIGTVGLSVDLNGVDLPSSAELLPSDPSIVAVNNYNTEFCDGTDLVVLYTGFSVWPFGYYTTFADHYSCSVNPETCDLIIGIATSIPASDETTADGSITINASSSNTIEYNIGSDFVYGSGQSSPTFSALLPGDYRIFLRDSKNCGANVLVSLGFSNTYGTIYRLEYEDFAGFQTRIDLTKRGYSGAVTEIKGQAVPFLINLSGEGGKDKFQALLPTKCDLRLTSVTEAQFIDLYTNDRNLFRVEYSKDFGSGLEQLWTGKVLPFVYQELVRSTPYEISVIGIDGLAELKDYAFVQDDGQKFYGTTKLIKLVSYCLSKLKLGLNIRVAVNLYANDMDQTATDDPFDQAYCDYEAFYLANDQPDLEFVLKSILEPFNARIVLWNNKWNILRAEEITGSVDYREFDSDGDYVSNSDFNLVKETNYPQLSDYVWQSYPNLELNPGYGTVQVTYKLGLKPNIINNGDFRLKTVFAGNLNGTPVYSLAVNTDGLTVVPADYPIYQGYEKIDDGNIAFYISSGRDTLESNQGGEAYIQTDTYDVKMGTNNQLKINIRYKIKRLSALFGISVYQIEVPYVKVRMRVKYGSLYLQNDGTWSSAATVLDFFATTFNEYLESEIVAQQPVTGTPTSGMDFDIRLYHAYGYYTQFQSLTSLRAYSTYSGGDQVIPTGYKTELRDSFVIGAKIYYYQLEETTDSESGYLIVRPDDYHVTNNPRQWVQKFTTAVGTLVGLNEFPFYVDRIKVSYLTDGKDPVDTIIRTEPAEPLNNLVYEKELILGSSQSLIVTNFILNLDLGVYFPPYQSIQQTINTLSADLIYTGYLRDSTGAGYELWARDGVSESATLHAIWLKSYAAQYSRSWRLKRGIIVSKSGYFGLINVVNDVPDSNRIYIPISLSLDDKNNTVDGEFLELITDGSGAGTGRAHSSGYSSGHS